MKSLIISFLFAVSIYGQNIMSILDYNGNFNDTLEIFIKISNTNNFVAFQTDVALPSQVTYISNSVVLTERSNGHTISASLLQNNVLRILAFSINQNTFFGDSGSVAKFRIKLKTDPGVFPIELINPIISNANSQNILTSFMNGSITIISPKINVTPLQHDFGSTPLWNSTDRIVSVQNTGSSDLIVNRVYTGNAYFRVIGDTTFTITPGNSRNVTIRFNSLKKGTYNTQLKIESNDPANNTINVSLDAVAFAVNELHAQPSFGRSGYPVDILFSMNNMEPVVGFQFDIVASNVLNFIPDSVFLSVRKHDHVISANYVSENRLRVVAFSPTNKSFSDSLGNILRVGFNLNGTGGNHYYQLENVIISDSSAQNVVSAFYPSYVNIASPDIHGDTNIDFGDVSVTDTATVNYQIDNYGNDTLHINSLTSNNASFWSDAVLPLVIPQSTSKIVKLYFHNSQKGSHTGRFTIRSNDPDEDPFYINLSSNAFAPNYIIANNSTGFSNDTITIAIGINNHEQFVAFQFDITLPDSLTYTTNSIRLSDRKQDHTITVANVGNNKYRIVAFSLTQKPFQGNTGDVVLLDALTGNTAGNFSILLSDGILSNAQSQNIIRSTINGSIELFNRPIKPVLISPLDNAVVNPFNILLQWSVDQNSTGYAVQVSTDSLFNTLVINEDNHNSNSYLLNNLNLTTKYYWRIKGINNAGSGEWSEVWNFKTLGGPTIPLLIQPVNNAVNQLTEGLVFKWRKASEQTESILAYWYELVTDTVTMSDLRRDTLLTDTTTVQNGLANYKDYFWRVKAKNETGWGTFSGWFRFRTIAVIGWCNLQWPGSAVITQGDSVGVYAQIWVNGITNGTGQGIGIDAWIGISTENTNPNTWTTWYPALYNTDIGNNDEYMYHLGKTLPKGSYYYASKFELTTGEIKYGGFNTGGGGFWNDTTNLSGILQINASPINAPSNLMATANAVKKVELAWTDNSNNETGFTLERKLGDSLSANQYTVIANLPANAIAYVDSVDLLDTTKYTYRVRAINADTVSVYSNQAVIQTMIPVELTSFSFNVNKKSILLLWSTATEVNNKGFEVERSETNDNQIAKWVKIGYVEGKGTTTNITDYQYLDGSITQSGKYTYRLKQIDYDGSYTYTFSIEVEIDLTPQEYSLSQNYPNPFNPYTIIRYSLPHGSNVKLEIFNALGERIETLINGFNESGYYEIEWNASGYSSGVYFYRLQAGDYSDIKKMIYLR